NLKSLEILLSDPESLIRHSMKRMDSTGSGLIQAFSKLYYLSGFLNLITLSRLSFLGGQFVTQKASTKKSLTGRDKSLLLTLMKQIRQVYDSISLAEDYGSFVTPSRKMIYPAVERINEEALKWIIRRFSQEGVTLPGRYPLRSLTMEKTAGGEWDITIPDPVFQQAGRGEYLSIAYIDLVLWQDPLVLVESLREWKQSGTLQFHGPLELPLEDEADPPSLPYYFIIKSREEPEKYWDQKRMPVRLLTTLSGPDQKIKLVAPAEPPEKRLDYNPEETLELEEQTLLFHPEDAKESEFHYLKVSEESPGSEDLDELPEENMRGSDKRGKAEPGTTIKYPIGIKMIIITSLIIVLALTGMIVLATFFFLQDSQVRVEESNLKISETIASQVEDSLLAVGNSASLLLLGAGNEETPKEVNYKNYYFRSERNILFAGIPEEDRLFYNENLLAELDVSESFIQGVINDHPEQIRLAKGGTPSVFNVSTYFGIPLLGVTVPYKQEQGIKTLFILTDIRSTLQKAVQSRGITSTFIVDSAGNLIAHPDKTILISGVNLGDITIVKELFSSAVNTGQIRYEQDGETYFGSYKKVSFGRLGIITTVPEKLAFEAIFRIQRRNILLMIMFVALAVLIIYYYSKSLSGPIRKLVSATRAIEEGQYTLDLKPKSQDEIGVLTRAFVNMGKGLEEKERIKDAFGRFVNKEMAEMAEKGEIQLGGEIKPATIFFSDIRSFTAISENLTPGEVVSFLNEYMTLMVDCVNQTDGSVDKYIGDAIMAIWGTPISHGNDAENAVNGALLMRRALRKFNQDRGGDRKPIIKIGCGLNSGDVLAGQIGSNDRMEYTVIGDAVNLASRIEALNKPMGSDVLISQGTADQVEGVFDLVPMNKIMVKGKSEPQQIYAVLGRMDDPDRPKSMKELREKVGITGNFDNIADVNMEKEEVKYEIMD
ncbi:adenylate/guanylate cyclase domain-containing protein, partial [Oceanispirochaeta sp.]|uniref:adenylate/guanylate cyclase domain-containing protein n=1 Tax=Oceanispirochaeta sp. TaxID=2035350 RepID=UPI002608182A